MVEEMRAGLARRTDLTQRAQRQSTLQLRSGQAEVAEKSNPRAGRASPAPTMVLGRRGACNTSGLGFIEGA
jgi:hypothetical protein